MSTTTRPVRLLINGNKVELADVKPTCSVLDYLRNEQRITGTKEGCAEGDCGACTVVLGEFVEDHFQLRTVNACLLFVPMLDGKALFTVEYLSHQTNGVLHPVQQAMVNYHGSQCGFCTPGFIMSLWSCYTHHQMAETRPIRDELAYALTGNLCRCTGYRPILDAGEAMFDLPAVPFDSEGIKAALLEFKDDASLVLTHPDGCFHSPRTLDELVQLRSDNDNTTLLAGCTDIGLWVNKQFRDLGDIVYVCNIPELKKLSLTDERLRIGAGVSLSDAYEALARHYPELNDMWDRFASVPIRNAGTLGGNIANGSPIGDSMPWLMALGAFVELAGSNGKRLIPLEELYVDYMQKSMQTDEVVSAIEVPLPTPQLHFRIYKLAKRRDSDISAVCAAFALWFDGTVIRQARVAFGGMAATPKRATLCEQVLLNQTWDEATVQSAMQALDQDFAPLDDMRASAAYRHKTARNLLYRCYLETRPNEPLSADQTRVFRSEHLGAKEAL